MISTNDYSIKASDYSKHCIEGTLLLAYREFNKLIKDYVKEGREALDFGCGAGRSTAFIRSLGFECEGVDISDEMITQAKETDINGSYTIIKDDKLPYRDSKFDLVVSTLVFLEMPTIESMYNALNEIYRTAKLDSTVIIMTVNDDFYIHDWISVDTNFPENINPKSGDLVKIRIKEINLTLNDYYWKKSDYRSAFELAGFSVVNELTPKANPTDDSQPWIDETNYSPYIIFTLKKKKAMQNISEFASKMGLINIGHDGWFKEEKRSPKEISIFREGDKSRSLRNKSSEITLLMEAGQYSYFHKSLSRETFKYLDGKDMILHLINRNGDYRKVYIGKEDETSVIEFDIPPDTWFAKEVVGENGFSLVSVKCEPGFDNEDIQVAKKEDLLLLISKDDSTVKIVDRLTIPNNNNELKI